MEEQIINRVAGSQLITFDLEEYSSPFERVLFDIKDNLFQGLILKEKDFRDFIKSHDWSQYKGKNVAVYCSVDAVIPTWAYMLLTIALQPFANKIVFGNLEALENQLFYDALSKVEWQKFQGAKVVIKGCSKVFVPTAAYLEATDRLRNYASSIMFGEACSTVPLYKRAKS
ncbi:MAG TPA: DUF2480 family protein [Cyclobacteriaceae bacterium]|jgi:hypothetical protein|nr:DUF2480 family protein [Cyclobacteriaceae bacterium]